MCVCVVALYSSECRNDCGRRCRLYRCYSSFTSSSGDPARHYHQIHESVYLLNSAANQKNKKRKMEEKEPAQTRMSSKQVCSLSSYRPQTFIRSIFIMGCPGMKIPDLSLLIVFCRDEPRSALRGWRKLACDIMKHTMWRTRTRTERPPTQTQKAQRPNGRSTDLEL